ncbi:MAG TPA: cytochrome c-type biogenesis protein CcmH [Candidatus Polarisedimenticolia bacterium]|nr:cytochrome c-type biogenesis protein CcmH [Candidatus Polarisedimenticolia bacterium]
MAGQRDALKGRIAGFAALGVLLVIVAVAMLSSRSGDAPPAPPPPAASAPQAQIPATGLTEQLPVMPAPGSTITAVVEDVALSPQAQLLAERFQCVCGCKDILATCTCKETPGSRDMKKYLQDLVDAGRSPAEVETAMIDRYGREVIP